MAFLGRVEQPDGLGTKERSADPPEVVRMANGRLRSLRRVMGLER